MMGFTYNNKHSSELDIVMKAVNRNIRPMKRTIEYIIPGRDGTLSFDKENYENRQIMIDIHFLTDSFEELRAKARNIAYWFSKSGGLVFDDEPNKLYQAKVTTAIDLEQIATTGRTTITFQCQPFAESLEYNQVNKPSITKKPFEIPVNVAGTSETCCIITIKNTGTMPINNITITRKAAI